MAGVALVALAGALGRRWLPLVARGAAPSTFVSLGWCGTWSHLPAFGVAGVALVALGGALGRRSSPGAPRHFAWQAWHLETSTFVSPGWRR